jgi:outer membrane usher protein FimD/PapC
MNKILSLSICTLIIILSGCSNKISVTGTVKYADGSPLTFGSVIFESDKEQYFGQLNTEGKFNLGGIKSGDGIPPGSYKVRLAGTEETQDTENDRVIVKHVDDKYTNIITSGLTAEIGKQRTFDFTVEKPEK